MGKTQGVAPRYPWRNAVGRVARAAALTLAILARPTPALAASLTVNTTDDTDDGLCDATHCSLREAINAANANSGPDTISFDLTGPSPYTILLTSPLPAITDGGTDIDGTSQPGYAGTPLIMLQMGFPMPAGGDFIGGVVLASGNNTIHGLSLVSFDFVTTSGGTCGGYDDSGGGGIVVRSGTGNEITESFVGLTPAGSPLGNRVGIFIHPDAPAQTIHNNVISGNVCGIVLSADGQVVQDNRIGTDPSGTSAVGSQSKGVVVQSNNNLIGGTGQGNLISGNGSAGLELATGDPSGNKIQSNLIGTDISGTAPLPNGGNGIYYVDGGGGSIGGNDPAEGNTVAYNLGAGMRLAGNREGVVFNQIFNNGAAGIDNLDGSWITRNRIYDNGDLGIYVPAGSVNQPPVLNSTNGAFVYGHVEDCPFCLIEVFIAAPDPSGTGEGKVYLGWAEASQPGDFSYELPLGLEACEELTATGTNDGTRATSRFSNNLTVPPCLRLYKWNRLLIPFIPLFFGILVGWLGGRSRGRPPRNGMFWGAVIGGGAGLLLVFGMGLVPFVKFIDPPQPPDIPEPVDETLFDLPGMTEEPLPTPAT